MMKLFIALAFISLNITTIDADDKICIIEGVVRCMCSASMSVDCGPDGKGNVKNDEKVKSVKILLVDKNTGTKRYITLKEEDLLNFKARDFYGINDSKDLRNLAGAKDKEEISADNLVMDQGVKLYQDSEAREEASSKPSPTTASNTPNCSYIDDFPQIANYSGSCGGKKICIARIQCKDVRGAPYVGLAACPALQNVCPSATDCAQDELISLTKDTGTSQVGTSLKSEAVQVIGK